MQTIIGLDNVGQCFRVPVRCLACHGLHLPVRVGLRRLFRGPCQSANERKTMKIWRWLADVAAQTFSLVDIDILNS